MKGEKPPPLRRGLGVGILRSKKRNFKQNSKKIAEFSLKIRTFK